MLDSMRANPDAPQTLLNRYRVLELAPEGGFGQVFICFDPKLKRRVAIKRIPVEGIKANEALSEARTASMLSHPNIVAMIDFEVDDTYAYLIMEYVDGLSLAQILEASGTISLDEASYIVRELGLALAFAHENGVLHLDVKPSNILIDHSGHVQLTDFGMANLASAAGYMGARGGTLGYMPPEQLNGEIVDERTDIFSLAVVIYEAITGIKIFDAQTPEQSLALQLKGPFHPSVYDLDISDEAGTQLLWALDARLDQRPDDVLSYTKDMTNLLGSPSAGKESLANYLNEIASDNPDATDETVIFQPTSAFARLLPRSMNLARIKTIILHLFSGVFAWSATLFAFKQIALFYPEIQTIAAICVGVVSIIVPALGLALTALAFVLALVFAKNYLVAFLFTCIFGLFWFICARKNKTVSTLAMSAPGLSGLSVSTLSPFIIGLFLPPAQATLTAGFAALPLVIAPLLSTQMENMLFFTEPYTLGILISWMFCAFVIAICVKYWEKAGAVGGGIAALCIILVTMFLIARLESGGANVLPDKNYILSACASFILYAIILWLFWDNETSNKSTDEVNSRS